MSAMRQSVSFAGRNPALAGNLVTVDMHRAWFHPRVRLP